MVYQPIYIQIITARNGTDEGENTEDVFLVRELQPCELGTLSRAKTPKEIKNLLRAMQADELNEPIVYEIDLRRY